MGHSAKTTTEEGDRRREDTQLKISKRRRKEKGIKIMPRKEKDRECVFMTMGEERTWIHI